MTDNEIIKYFNSIYTKLLDVKYDLKITHKEFSALNEVYNLITRQQADIERLKKDGKDIDEFARNICKERLLQGKAITDFDTLLKYIKTQKSEAVKEFAERLKNEIINDTAYACDSTQHSGYYDYQIKIGDTPEYIDNLVKEMVGDDNA